MIDHIVYAVPNLDEGINEIHQKLGVKPVYGGKHIYQGTHNAILKLGNGCYFELIAVDPDNVKIDPPRWMGVDLVKTPCISRWAIKSSDIASDINHLSVINPELGLSKEGQRVTGSGKLLKWHLSIPLGMPLVETAPFLIDWKDSVHPSENLEDSCKIESFELFATNSIALNQTLSALKLNIKVKQANKNSIHLTVRSPNGLVKL